jgi:hypothetical protein
LKLRRDGFHLSLGQPQFAQVAIGNQPHAMAGRADFLVNLEAALGAGAIIGAENPIKGEFPIRDGNLSPRRMGGGGSEKAKGEGESLD